MDKGAAVFALNLFSIILNICFLPFTTLYVLLLIERVDDQTYTGYSRH